MDASINNNSPFSPAAPGRFTKVSVQTAAGEIEARLSEAGNWELRLRRRQPARGPRPPPVIVVDASVLAPALADDGDNGDQARGRLQGEQLAAPELIDLEVLSILRRAARAKRLDARRSGQALDDLAALPLQRVSHLPLLDRAGSSATTSAPTMPPMSLLPRPSTRC